MRKFIIPLILLVASCAYAQRDIEPIEVKPILVTEQRQWKLTGAYYRKVKVGDKEIELKSKKPLTDKQWFELADKIKEPNIEENICPTCGRP